MSARAARSTTCTSSPVGRGGCDAPGRGGVRRRGHRGNSSSSRLRCPSASRSPSPTRSPGLPRRRSSYHPARLDCRRDRRDLDRLPHGLHRGRRLPRQRHPREPPRRQPSRAPPRLRSRGAARDARARPRAHEAPQRQRDPHLALPAASRPARPRRPARVLGDRRVRPRDPRLRRRRLAAEPHRRSGLGGRAPRPGRPHGRARPEPPEHHHVVARQRGRRRPESRGDGRRDPRARRRPVRCTTRATRSAATSTSGPACTRRTTTWQPSAGWRRPRSTTLRSTLDAARCRSCSASTCTRWAPDPAV